jgi:Membrane dipeptidase (Peptidase family M19)
MTSPRHIPIFDGHNDVLLRLYRRGGTDAPRAFLEGEGKGQLDLPTARQGGFAGGLFAIFVPSANGATGPNGQAPSQNVSGGAPLPPAVELMPAQRAVFAMVSLLLRIEPRPEGLGLLACECPAQGLQAECRGHGRVQKNFAERVAEIRAKLAPDTPVEVWFQDEMRVGQKNKLTYRWARKGSRPRAIHDQRTQSTYLFGAVCPDRGTGAALVLPCNSKAMQLHLDEIATKVTAGSAKVVTSSICLSVNGRTELRRSEITPIGVPSRSKGTPRTVRKPSFCRMSKFVYSGSASTSAK